MQRGRMILTAAIAMAIAVAGVAFAGGMNNEASAGGNPNENAATRLADACDFPTTGRSTRIATAKLIIEYNATDDDIGVHGAFDDHGWKRLCVFDPSGKPVLHVGPRGQLLDLTMAGIFFESREPPASEFSFADLRAAFPEGGYTLRGESLDGTLLIGSATFTHDVPAAPLITAPELAGDPKGTRANPVPLDGLVIDWDQVTTTVDGGPVSIAGYEVIVTRRSTTIRTGSHVRRTTCTCHRPWTVSRCRGSSSSPTPCTRWRSSLSRSAATRPSASASSRRRRTRLLPLSSQRPRGLTARGRFHPIPGKKVTRPARSSPPCEGRPLRPLPPALHLGRGR